MSKKLSEQRPFTTSVRTFCGGPRNRYALIKHKRPFTLRFQCQLNTIFVYSALHIVGNNGFDAYKSVKENVSPKSATKSSIG